LASKPTPPIKEYEMSTISNTTRRSASMNFVIALVITLAAILAAAISQFVVAPRPAAAPITERENAHVEYLRGEKTIYANPVALSNALAAYHLGEKVWFEAALNKDAALSRYLAGEKIVVEDPMDLGAAMTAYHIGEKLVAPSLESAMWEYRQGEKNLE
jgi:hypothetical protein